MNNLELFRFGKQYPEPLFDPFYSKSCVVIPYDVSEENDLTTSNTRLIKLISTFDTLHFEQNKNLSDKTITDTITSIIDILDHTNNINYTPFSQFFMVYNASYSVYESLTYEDKISFIYEMLERYCVERHGMYLSHGYSNIVMQVMSDNYSHKRKGKAGIEKILAQLRPYDLRRITYYSDIESCDDIYFLPDKGDKVSFEKFLVDKAIKMKSREIEQNKLPDIVFKHNNQYYICELKSMKGQGGGQNKQIVEVAYFIKFSEADENIHYVTFLDSQYSNELMNANNPKIVKQREDIEVALINNPGNYFLNTASLQVFLEQVFAI